MSAVYPTIDIANPATWPVRMKLSEVALVLRKSQRCVRDRIDQGRFPKADDGTWSRETVKLYCEKQVKDYERDYRRRESKGRMAVVAGGRR